MLLKQKLGFYCLAKQTTAPVYGEGNEIFLIGKSSSKYFQEKNEYIRETIDLRKHGFLE